MTDITWIICGVLTVLGVLFTAIIIPLIKSKKTSEEWSIIENKAKMVTGWITTGIRAAEMFFKGTGLGSDKNLWVLSFVKTLCEKYNVTFDQDLVRSKIEEVGVQLGLWGVEDEIESK